MRGAGRGRSANGERPPFPESIPRAINHSVLTGTLSAEPEPGHSPTGEPVTLLRVVFPVADPDRPRALWAWASCPIEVPGHRRLDAEGLREGAAVLAAGQLSDRWLVEGGHANRRGVIVAALIKSGPAAARQEAPR